MATRRPIQREEPPQRFRLAGYPMVFSLLAALLTFVGAGEPLETSIGLRQLYKLRGVESPPPNALIIAVSEPAVSRINAGASTIPRADHDAPLTAAEVAASEFAKELPGLANCMPTRDIENLATMRNKNLIPRSVHACLLPILNARNPTAIFFDILFEERSDVVGDQLFADALAVTPNAVILREIKRDRDIGVLVSRFPTPVIREAVGDDRLAFFVVDNLADSTRYVERFAEVPNTRNAPSAVLDLHLARPAAPPPPAPGPGLDLLSEFWLYGPPGVIPVISLADVFARPDAAPLRDLSDTAVFIGAWEKNTQNVDDSFTTPLSDDQVGDHFGIELAATAFLNKLTGKALIRPTYGARAAIVGVLAFLMLALGRLMTGYRGMVAIAVVGALWVILGWWALKVGQIWLPFAVPIFILAPLSAILSIGANYARVRDVVQRLAPLPIARLLIAQRDRGPMKMREEVGTVLFADLTGSTGIAENISVGEFKDLMNTFFDMAAEAIETEGGMIDKFMGDGFMALFTESFTGEDHADRAVAASRKLARDVRVFNIDRGDVDTPALTMRIGLNTGLMAIGEVGARSRANPTAVGDVVNVAARLEQLGRDMFAGEREVILLSGVTFHYLKNPPHNLVDCGEKNIRGRKNPVKVIRLTIQ